MPCHTLSVVCASVLHAKVLYVNVVYSTLVCVRGLGLEAPAGLLLHLVSKPLYSTLFLSLSTPPYL